MKPNHTRTIIGLSLFFLSTTIAHADVVIIDAATVGSVYDGILDGFPFPPPGLAPDGVGDFTNNALAVALQTGVTEERGIIELPLAPLVGATSSTLQSAILTFNIDDVVATFGPGTTFDGTAASSIAVFAYAGNGAIDLADFGNVVGAPLAVIDTTPLGVITDGTLAVSGPLTFTVDATTVLGALLDSGAATHIGFVFATQDNLSATSLDNLGPGGAGPAGIGGAAMPFLTITTGAGDPPVFSPTALVCQKAIGKAGTKFAAKRQKALSGCLDRVLNDAADGAGFSTSATKCVAALDTGNPDSLLAKAIVKFNDTIDKKCGTLTPADINSPCDSAADISAVRACLLAHHSEQVDEMVRAGYADACALISAVGLEASFPTLCEAP